MRVQKTYLGYWYQRTTLHLSEIFDFLSTGDSPLWFSKHELVELHKNLHIKNVQLKTGTLESIQLDAADGLSVQIFEDGLVVLSNDHTEIQKDIRELTDYFEQSFSPAISYLFSLGAPVPKELANIKTVFPYFIVTTGGTKTEIAKLLKDLGEGEYYEIKSADAEIYRGDRYYILNTKVSLARIEELIGTLIFFREFKAQLHHYLNLHRQIWEKIERIKEQRQIRGELVIPQRAELESYKKTVELIKGRINQMGIYISTRSAIAQKNKWDEYLSTVLQFRYDNLDNTLDYIKSLWSMTKRYLDSAIEIFTEINSLSTRNSVQALTIISSVGVVSGMIGFMSATKLPKPTGIGLVYYLSLIIGAILINKLLTLFYRRMKYKINDVKLAKFTNRRP